MNKSTRRRWIAVLLVAGLVGVVYLLRGRTTPGKPISLTAQDEVEIAALVRRETSSPIRSMVPQPNGTVLVPTGQDQQLGGEYFTVQKGEDGWKITERLLTF